MNDRETMHRLEQIAVSFSAPTPATPPAQEPPPDELGMTWWWNTLTERERAAWLRAAGSAAVADAWAAFKGMQ